MKKLIKNLLVTTASIGIISGATAGAIIETQNANTHSNVHSTASGNTVSVDAVNQLINTFIVTAYGVDSATHRNVIAITNASGQIPQLPGAGVNLIFAITHGYQPTVDEWKENIPQKGIRNGMLFWVSARIWGNYTKSDPALNFVTKSFPITSLSPAGSEKRVDPLAFNSSTWKYTISAGKVTPPEQFQFPHIQVLYLVQHPSQIDYGTAYNTPVHYSITPPDYSALKNDDILWIFATPAFGYAWKNTVVLPKMITIHGVN